MIDEKIEAKITALLQEMTIEEKAMLVHGKDFWTTNSIDRVGIPSFGMTDGPLGVGWHSSKKTKATRFPATIGLAATWNKTLAYKTGEVIGKETKAAGRHQILAPGVNIQRSPLGGRNFEYLSEDPILSSDMASEFVKGVQDQKIASCVKHFVTNNSETKRMNISTEIDERTLNEIYIKNYKRIVKKSDPWGMMACYNKVNGIHGADNHHVLQKILRENLGFTGHVVTDWFAARNTHSATTCIKAGLNLEMPGMSKKMALKNIMPLIKNGELNDADLDFAVRPMLRTFYRVGLFDDPLVKPTRLIDNLDHQLVAQQVAEESMVLLKNDAEALPLKINEIKKICILGPNAKRKFAKPLSGGSSAVVPPRFITPWEGIKNYIRGKATIVKKPEDADTVLLFMGLKHEGLLSKKEGDSEGRDRTILDLPLKQEQLILETVAKNPNTIVILIMGSPISMDNWIAKPKAILNAWYPNMMGGDALARVLFGDVNPSGKLPITYPKSLSDSPAHKAPRNFPGDLEALKIYYDEGIYIGYRHFDKKEIEPLYPFGFGLSYTTFKFENIKVDSPTIGSKDTFTVSLDVTNTGNRAGSEVVQVYIGDDDCSVDRPPRELQGFEKIYLNSGETKTISIMLDTSAFEFYDVNTHGWIKETGSFTIEVGNSSRNLPLSTKISFENKN